MPRARPPHTGQADTPTLRVVQGEAVAPYLADVAQLRITVFREYPYLYEGDLAYEADYLATYAQSPRSVFVLALAGDRVVGAATALPLLDEDEAVQRPFVAQGLALDKVCYFGESVLLPAYRGLGVGHRFFDEREQHARRLGAELCTFCCVERAADDPRRPRAHRDNDVFWAQRGYQRQAHLRCQLAGREVGATTASPQQLVFWLRSL